jgi:glycosyltransferase involved in cell wall biosynthesis
VRGIERVTLLIGPWQVKYFDEAFGATSFPKVSIVPAALDNSSLDRNRWYLANLPQVARRDHFDIVHLSFPAPVIARAVKSAVVTTLHDLYPYDCAQNFGFPQCYLNRAVLRMCMANTAGVICVSDATMRRAEAIFGTAFVQKRRQTIYNVVDLSSHTPIRPPFIERDRPFLLTVGQHRKNKNLDVLIRAFSQLLHKHHVASYIRLVIVGSPGPETERLRSLVLTERLADNVLFGTSLQEENLRWLYAKCDLFVVASAVEGFCIPLVEARQLAGRIVCSDIPVLREFAGSRCAFFSLGGDAERNLFVSIIASLSREASVPEGAMAEFSPECVGAQVADFYASVLGS